MRPIFVLASLALFASTAAAQADALPLKRGVYVETGYACKGAPAVGLVGYYGDRLAPGHDSCRIVSTRKAGGATQARLKCSSGAAVTWMVRPQGAAAFARTVDGQSASYRWCAATAKAL